MTGSQGLCFVELVSLTLIFNQIISQLHQLVSKSDQNLKSTKIGPEPEGFQFGPNLSYAFVIASKVL